MNFIPWVQVYDFFCLFVILLRLIDCGCCSKNEQFLEQFALLGNFSQTLNNRRSFAHTNMINITVFVCWNKLRLESSEREIQIIIWCYSVKESTSPAKLKLTTSTYSLYVMLYLQTSESNMLLSLALVMTIVRRKLQKQHQETNLTI